MSLIEQIKQRNMQQVQEQQQAQAAQVEEMNKPDAGMQLATQRNEMSNMVANSNDHELMEEPATEEEQRQFTALEAQIIEFLNTPEKAQRLMSVVNSAQDPVEGIAIASHDLLSVIEKNNPNVDDEIMAELGTAAIEQVVEVAERFNPEINLNDNQVAEAYSVGLKLWLESHPDSLDRNDPEMATYLAQPAPQQLHGGFQQ